MLWIKVIHILAVISWFAGLLYLPRLFVYHADSNDEISNRRFTVMERRLYFRIMTPAMVIALLSGAALVGFGIGGGWLGTKLLFVAGVIAFHISCYVYLTRLAAGRHPSARFFRFYNELPTLLLIIIVVLVVVKPF